ncbi:hypothetical protein [Mycobacteroides abscessus]|uniref:hypothetical protein n=1 Tax=Mycobacteroides abscessus TaxID=36809 RepID=UPI0009D072B6|nr:hypothetical protein [Mycobacteroides abscessus]SLJ09247.1 Uncharacterised protein [Mycobacteroides abscessus subsp. abscessus]
MRRDRLDGYTLDELARAVRVERVELVKELRTLTRRVREIEDRLAQLRVADELLAP